jgi:hypothetical protein
MKARLVALVLALACAAGVAAAHLRQPAAAPATAIIAATEDPIVVDETPSGWYDAEKDPPASAT